MMNSAGEDTTLQLIVERTFDAPRDRVFRAWIDPVLMGKWFAPVGMRPVEVQVEPQVGGKFRFGMQEPAGRIYHVSGEYIEIAIPERLVFTWLTEQQREHTVITVEFHDLGASTHVVLTHERLRDAATKDGNREGWNNCFESLHQHLLSGDV